MALVEEQGQVVGKQALMERVWPDTFVEEANLSVNVSLLRKALGKQDDGRLWIETLSRRGYRFAGKARPVSASLRALAVLPFRSLDGGPGDEAFGLGMADALITRLGHLGQIVVRPTSAVVKHGGRDPRQAGRELQVDAVLDGRIQRADNRVRATVQMLGVADGASLWADTFDEAFTHIFDVQDAIAEKVAQSLTVRLSAADRERMAQRPTESVEAYQAYLRGRYFWNKLTGPWLEKAREAFEEAIGRDPAFALAQAGLADTCIMLGLYGLRPPQEAFAQARSSAETATRADPGLAEAHVSLAYARLFGEWAWAEAEHALGCALTLNPASASVRGWHALYLGMTGDLPAAFEEVRRAQELDPMSLTLSTNAGFQFYLAHQYDSEIGQHRRTLELEPDYAVGHWALALAYEQKGMLEEAIAEHRKAVSLSGGSVLMKANLGRAYGLSGRKREAREVLRELEAAAVSPYRIATVHLALGDVAATFEWLQRAYRERDHWMVWLKVDPMLESLRGDRRYQTLVKKVGFPTLTPAPLPSRERG